jgi:hypothetical protein
VTARGLRPFGTTIFTEMSALAARTGALNLGQGSPDTDGPREVVEAVTTTMRSGFNQYAPLPGIPELRAAIAGHQRRRYGIDLDPPASSQPGRSTLVRHVTVPTLARARGAIGCAGGVTSTDVKDPRTAMPQVPVPRWRQRPRGCRW